MADYTCFMQVLRVGAVEGCVCGHLCDGPCVSALRVCTGLQNMCLASVVVEPANGKVAAASLSLDMGPRSPGWASAVKQKGVLSWIRQACSKHPLKLTNHHITWKEIQDIIKKP